MIMFAIGADDAMQVAAAATSQTAHPAACWPLQPQPQTTICPLCARDVCEGPAGSTAQLGTLMPPNLAQGASRGAFHQLMLAEYINATKVQMQQLAVDESGFKHSCEHYWSPAPFKELS